MDLKIGVRCFPLVSFFAVFIVFPFIGSRPPNGNYGSKIENNRMIRLRNDSTLVKIKAKGLLLKPSVLLYSDSIPERACYPQIGCLVNWLFDTYGVEKINLLYPVKRKIIEKKFGEVTGESFAEMERRYLEYQATNSH